MNIFVGGSSKDTTNNGFFDGLLQQSMRAVKENFSLDLTSYAFIVNESKKGINYLKGLGF